MQLLKTRQLKYIQIKPEQLITVFSHQFLQKKAANIQ